LVVNILKFRLIFYSNKVCMSNKFIFINFSKENNSKWRKHCNF